VRDVFAAAARWFEGGRSFASAARVGLRESAAAAADFVKEMPQPDGA
jgi:hypothetical protein